MDPITMNRLGNIRQQEILEQVGYLRRQPHTEFTPLGRLFVGLWRRIRPVGQPVKVTRQPRQTPYPCNGQQVRS